jgi:hypothetical protein
MVPETEQYQSTVKWERQSRLSEVVGPHGDNSTNRCGHHTDFEVYHMPRYINRS